MRYLALAGFVTLLLAIPAAAMTDTQRLALFLPVAQAQWPDSPCAGREQITLNDDAELDALTARVGTRPDGVADAGLCTIGISSGLDDYHFCVVLTHEDGHLAGESHSTDPASIMYPVEISDYQPCLDATPQTVAAPQPNGYLARRPKMVIDDVQVQLFPRHYRHRHRGKLVSVHSR